MRFQGVLYRALIPVRAGAPLSGEGARLNGGRFNPKGVPALYTSLAPVASIREAGGAGLPLQPVVIVSYEAGIDPIFDATEAENLADYGVTEDELAENWRSHTKGGTKSPGQILAGRLIADGFAAMKVRSFALGAAAAEDVNMVLWTWEPDSPARLVLNDAEGRLKRLAVAGAAPRPAE